jgi:hypothetical protein
MDGVQFVLHNPQYITEYTWGWSWMGFLTGILALVFIGIFIFLIETGDPAYIACAVFVCVFIFGTLSLFSTAKENKSYSHSEYVVVIHEDVDCKEFLKKYEVIEQNGDLITVKERNNDDT